MRYELHDSRGLPQCGCEVTSFDTWWELEDHLDSHPDVMERIEEMYATIVEIVDEEEYADELASWMNGLAERRQA